MTRRRLHLLASCSRCASSPWVVACRTTPRRVTSRPATSRSISSLQPRRPTPRRRAVTRDRCSWSGPERLAAVGRQLSPRDDALVAISTLLQGPTADEAAQGLRTAIPSGTRLLAADLKDGVLHDRPVEGLPRRARALSSACSRPARLHCDRHAEGRQRPVRDRRDAQGGAASTTAASRHSPSPGSRTRRSTRSGCPRRHRVAGCRPRRRPRRPCRPPPATTAAAPPTT